MTTSENTPVEIDTALAEAWHAINKAEQQRGYSISSIMHEFGGKRTALYSRDRARYMGDPRLVGGSLYERSLDEALTVARDLATGAGEIDWSNVTDENRQAKLAMSRANDAAEDLAKFDARQADVEAAHAAADAIEDLYQGWSRFFVVTSSPGHIHSSRHCSTCRVTTTYGWLPGLSGSTEAEAVAIHGPALCSVCYPSAPVEMVGGKLTKSQAEKAAA